MDSETSILKQNGEKEPQDPNAHPKKATGDKSWSEKWRKKWKDMTAANKLMVSFTGVIAFCTIVYAAVSWCQWKALLDSNEINREALYSVQRAYVNFSTTIMPQGDVDPKTQKITTWEFSVPIENSGDTPTRGMILHADIYHSKDAIPEDFTYPDTGDVTRQLTVLEPKGKSGTGHVVASSEVIKAVQDRKEHLYIYGWCKYRDVFPSTPEHTTQFCYRLEAVGGDPFSKDGPHDTFWSACLHHNCTDDDCKAEKPN